MGNHESSLMVNLQDDSAVRDSSLVEKRLMLTSLEGSVNYNDPRQIQRMLSDSNIMKRDCNEHNKLGFFVPVE